MSLNCQNLTMTPDPKPYTIENPPVGWAVMSNFDYFHLATTTDDRNGSAHGFPNVPRPIALRAASFENENSALATAMCNLITSNIELNVTFVGAQCSTVAIRTSQERPTGRHLTLQKFPTQITLPSASCKPLSMQLYSCVKPRRLQWSIILCFQTLPSTHPGEHETLR